MFMVADEIAEPKQAVALWLHEQGLHVGLRGLFGDKAEELDLFLDEVAERFSGGHLERIAADEGIDIETEGGRREAAEEVLARIAERVELGEVLSGDDLKTWRRVVAQIRRWLRDHGLDIELTRLSDAEIAQVVKNSIRWTMSGEGSGQGREPAILYQPLNAGVDPNKKVSIIDLSDVKPFKTISAKTTKAFLKMWDGIPLRINALDGTEWDSPLFLKNKKHVFWSGRAGSARYRMSRRKGLAALDRILSNAELIESFPNKDRTGVKKDVDTIHRFYIPVSVNGKVRTLRIVCTQKEGALPNIDGVELYDLIEENPRPITGEGVATGVASPPEGTSPGLESPGALPSRKIKISDMLAGVKDAFGDPYFKQGNKGAVQFLEDGRALIRLFEKGDVSTIIHEVGHILRRQVSGKDLSVLEKHFQVVNGMWTREAEERFADAWERYVYEGQAPSQRVRMVFSRLREWMVRIYHNIKHMRSGEIAPAVREVFDGLVTTTEQRRAEADAAKAGNSFQVDPEISRVDEEMPVPEEDLLEWEDLLAEAERRAVAHFEKEERKDTRKLLAQWRQEANEMVEQSPVHRNIARLTRTRDKGTKNERKGPGIDLDLMREEFAELADELMRKRPGLLKKGGLAPDLAAAEIGYADSEEMLYAFLEAPSKKEMADEWLNARIFEHERMKALQGRFGQDYFAIQKEIQNILEKLTRRATQKRKRAEIRERVGNMKVVGLGRTRQKLLHSRAASQREAMEAFNRGELDVAQKAMEKQAEVDMVLREVERALAAKDRRINSVKYLLRRKIPFEFREQATAWAARFGLTGRKAGRPRDSLLQFLTTKGVADFVDKSRIGWIMRRSPQTLTVSELEDAQTILKQIVHFGVWDGKMLAAKEQQKFEDVLDEVTATIRAYGPGKSDDYGPPDFVYHKGAFENFMGGVRAVHAMMLKAETLFRAFDGFKDMGTCWRHLFQPIKKAEDAELELGESVLAEVRAAFAPFKSQLKKWGKEKIAVPGVSRLLTKEQIIMVALNTGNKGNLDALKLGWRFTYKQIDAITKQLSKEEWQLVRNIWAAIDKLYPHLNAAHKRLTGVPLKKVEGQYFPLVFERSVDVKADRFATLAEQRDMWQSIYNKPKPESGMTKERVGGTMAPRLFFDVITKHITNSVHYATHAVTVRDVQKLTANKDFRQVVESKYGKEYYRQITPWLQNIAKPVREVGGPWEKFISRARQNTTVVALGMKISVALKQTLSLTQTVNEVGLKQTAEAIGVFLRHPWKMFEEVNRMSPAMRNRRNRWDREIQHMSREVTPREFKGNRAVRDSFFAMIGFMDTLATYPTWLAAYSKAMEDNGWKEAEAIEYADMVVRMTQPASSAKDLSEIQRGSEWRRMCTMFYTFFNVFYQRFYETNAKFRRGQTTPADLFKSYWWLVIAPAVIGDAITKREIPDEPEDVLKSIGGYMLAAVPVVRDIVSPLFTGYDYTFSPVVDSLASLDRLADAVTAKEDVGRKVTKQIIMMLGYLYGLPSRQAAIAMDGALDLASGKTKDWSRLAFPEKRDKKNKLRAGRGK